MSENRCKRCGQEEYIPTSQFVKFDDGVHYLCASCWEYFRRWYHTGRRDRAPHTDAIR